MSRKVLDNKVIKLGLDASEVDKGLLKLDSGIKQFGANLSKSTLKGFDGIGSSISNTTNKIQNLGASIGSLRSDKISEMGASFANMSGGIDNTNSFISSLSGGVAGVATQFSILDTAAGVALGNMITQGAHFVNNFVKGFTLDPVLGGFREYEKELESTRVLMASLGDDQLPNIVNKMAELEQYASTTRYNVQDMNAAIAQFVNAGIDIDTATDAIQGFGNLAAGAAATTQQFSGALRFGIQQALQMGTMNLMNWRTIEQSNIGNMKFKESLIAIGKEMGTLTDLTEEQTKVGYLFGEGLADLDWLTNEVLLEGLRKAKEDMSLRELAENVFTYGEAVEAIGENVNNTWSRVWRNILGYGKETSKIWTPFAEEVGGALNATGAAVEQVSKAFYDLNGHVPVFDLFKNLWAQAKLVTDRIGKAWKLVFPDVKADGTAKAIIKFFTDLNKLLVVPDGTLDGIQQVTETTFGLLKDILSLAGGIGKAIAFIVPDHSLAAIGLFIDIVGTLYETIRSLAGVFVEVLFPAKEFKKTINEFDKTSSEGMRELVELLYKARNYLNDHLLIWPNLFKEWLEGIKTGKAFNDGLSATEVIFGSMVGSVSLITEAFGYLKNAISNIVSGGISLFNSESDKMSEGVSRIHEFLSNLGIDLEKIGKSLDDASKKFTNFFTRLTVDTDSVKRDVVGVFKDLGDYIDWFVNGNTAYANELEEGGKTIDASNKSYQKYRKSLEEYRKIQNDSTKSDVEKRQALQKLEQSYKDLDVSLGKSKSSMESTVKSGNLLVRVFQSTNHAISQSLNFDDFIEGLMGVATTSENANTKMRDFGDFLNRSFNVSGSGLVEWFSTISESITSSFSTWDDTLEKWISSIGTFVSVLSFDSLNSFVGSLFSAIGSGLTSAYNTLSNISKPLANVAKTIGDAFYKIGSILLSPAAFNLANLILFYRIVKNIDSISDSLSNTFKSLSKTISESGKNIVKIFDNISGAMKAYTNSIKARTLRDIASATLVLAGALFVISTIPTDKLVPSLSTLAGVMLTLSVSFLAVQKALSLNGDKNNSLSNITKSFLIEIPGLQDISSAINRMTMIIGVIGTIKVAIDAISVLGEMDWEEIGKGMAALAGIMALIVLATNLNFNDKQYTLGDALLIYGLAKAIETLVGVIDTINNISTTAMDNAGGVMFAIGGVLVLAFMMMSGDLSFVGGTNAVTISSGNATNGAALSMLSLIWGVKSLSDMMVNLSAVDVMKIEKGTSVISSLARGIGLAFALMTGKINVSVGGQSIDIASGVNTKWSSFVAMGTLILGIDYLADELTKLVNKYPSGLEIVKATTIVYGIGTALGGIMFAMGFQGNASNGMVSGSVMSKITWSTFATLGTLVLGIVYIASELTKLAESTDLPTLATAGLIFTAISSAIMAMVAVVGVLEYFVDIQTTTVATFAILVLGLIGIMNEMQDLNKVKTEGLGGKIGGIAVILVMIGALLFGLSQMNLGITDLTGLAMGIGSVVIVGMTLERLSQLNQANLWSSAGVIVLTMLSIGIMAWLTSKITGIGGLTSIGILLSAAVSILAVSSALQGLQGISAGGLIGSILAIVVTMAAVVGLGIVATPAILGLVGIGVAMAGIGVAAWGMGTGLASVIDSITNFLRMVEETNMSAGRLSEIISAVVTGFADGIVRVFTEVIPKALVAFLEAVPKYGEQIWQASLKIMEWFVKGIADGIVWVAENWDKIWGEINKWWNKVNPKLFELGGKLLISLGKGILGAIGNIGNWFGAVWNSINAHLSNMGQKFYNAGAAMLRDLAKGISDNASLVVDKLSDVLGGSIQDLLPRSPAKKGPLSGSKWYVFQKSGRAMMRDLALGIQNGADDVVKNVSSTLEEVSLSLSDLESVGSDLRPTITPVVDMSQIESSGFLNLNGLTMPRIDFDVNYDTLNANLAATISNNQNMNQLAKGLDSMSAELAELKQLNQGQLTELRTGLNPNVYLDGSLMNEKLAPGMQDAQDAHLNRLNRIGGII